MKAIIEGSMLLGATVLIILDQFTRKYGEANQVIPCHFWTDTAKFTYSRRVSIPKHILYLNITVSLCQWCANYSNENRNMAFPWFQPITKLLHTAFHFVCSCQMNHAWLPDVGLHAHLAILYIWKFRPLHITVRCRYSAVNLIKSIHKDTP